LGGQLIFGTLPGWWLGEEPERQMSPNAPFEMWKRVLLETGFTGVDFDVADYEEPAFQSARVMLSWASTTVQCPFSIVRPPSQKPFREPGKFPEREAWLRDVSYAITSFTRKPPSIVSLENVKAWQDTVCIFTAEMEGPSVDDMDATTFDQLKKLLNHSSGLLWLSCGGLIDATEPSFGVTVGLIRTMRQEDPGKRWIRPDKNPRCSLEEHPS
jgi:hypothetical protein